jgi:hypothetical protein
MSRCRQARGRRRSFQYTAPRGPEKSLLRGQGRTVVTPRAGCPRIRMRTCEPERGLGTGYKARADWIGGAFDGSCQWGRGILGPVDDRVGRAAIRWRRDHSICW